MAEIVSIILPVYNGQRYLKEQIESILEQTYRNLEIIIIDDNSQDKSLSIGNRLAEKDSRIKIHRNERNLGVVPNFLKGASFAKGEFVCFCDQDDYWRGDKVEILKDLLGKDADSMLAYSDLEICDDRLKPIMPSFWKSSGLMPRKGYLRELCFLKNITPGCSMMFRKKVAVLLANVPIDAPFMHDHLALVLASGLGKIVYSEERLVKYRQHDRNNIGAFYNSVIDKERIIRELQVKVNYFRKLSLKGIDFDLDRMLAFCDCLKKGGIAQRLSFINYYLFLRNDSFWDKSLGVMECLTPQGYALLRKMKNFMPQFKRIIFAIWVLIVFFFFTKEFIIYKFVKFLGYMK